MTKAQKTKALAAVNANIGRCPVCLKNAVGKLVPGEGSASAKVLFLGEAPGKNEAVTGRPFIGRSGQLLRASIRAAGLKEEDVFITSAVKYLPKHVTPKPAEVEHGRLHLSAQLDVIQPKLIVLLGRIAALSILKRNVNMSEEHGSIIPDQGRKYFLSYHPAAALYSQSGKKNFEQDMETLARKIKGVL